MRFEDYYIDLELKKNLSKLGFTRPTDIQFKAIPSILKGEDVLAIAQTGTGKTAAFAIPVIHKLNVQKKKSFRNEGIRCIVMVPTRELAMQIDGVFKTMCRHTKVRSLAVHGGVEQDPQIEQLKKGTDVLIATPGRMFDLVSQGHIKLNRIQMLVLDEADHMLDLGFIEDIKMLIRFLPKRRQTLFFSATINEEIKRLAYSLVNNPIRIQLSPKNPVSKNVTHKVAFIEMDDKRFFLEQLIKENKDEKILVFVRTQVRAERVCKALARVDIGSEVIHGGKEQKERLAVLNRFRSGKNKVLIATDVSARGIDIEGVNLVVNYDLPDQAQNYVHRIGRTGRANQKGEAYSFCSEGEKVFLNKIEDFIGQPVRVLDIDKKEYKTVLDEVSKGLETLDDMLGEIGMMEEKKRKKEKRRK